MNDEPIFPMVADSIAEEERRGLASLRRRAERLKSAPTDTPLQRKIKANAEADTQKAIQELEDRLAPLPE